MTIEQAVSTPSKNDRKKPATVLPSAKIGYSREEITGGLLSSSCSDFFFLTAALSSALASDATFHSGPAQAALIELYTSEGCSSCPPAEKWLGDLRENSTLWKEIVPVAFHVNYWDHLGWRDALASKNFTDREYAHAAEWRSDSVYTPCFVRDGSEWRPGNAFSRANSASARDAGTLTLRWNAAANTCAVEYVPRVGAKEKLEVSVALLGGGIVTDVRKGENAGRELRHEFVALRLENAPLARNASSGALTATITLPPRADIKAVRRALAAWVSPRGQLAPVQATGGWLD